MSKTTCNYESIYSSLQFDHYYALTYASTYVIVP